LVFREFRVQADIDADPPEADAGPVSFGLPAILDAVAAEELLGLLRGHAPGAAPLMLDAAAVERLSTNGVQVLLAAARDGARAVRVARPSAAFTAGFAALGLGDALATWMAGS
jgi:anti-anti-sigma regulatory factor